MQKVKKKGKLSRNINSKDGQVLCMPHTNYDEYLFPKGNIMSGLPININYTISSITRYMYKTPT